MNESFYKFCSLCYFSCVWLAVYLSVLWRTCYLLVLYLLLLGKWDYLAPNFPHLQCFSLFQTLQILYTWADVWVIEALKGRKSISRLFLGFFRSFHFLNSALLYGLLGTCNSRSAKHDFIRAKYDCIWAKHDYIRSLYDPMPVQNSVSSQLLIWKCRSTWQRIQFNLRFLAISHSSNLICCYHTVP